MQRWLITAAVLTISLSLLGCGKSESGSAPTGASGEQAGKYLVIFSQCNNAEPYRAEQNKQFAAAFAQYPQVEFVITDGQADAAKQISQIENAIQRQPDLLIVAPLERNSLTAVMGKAMEAGIPTICLERDIAQPNYTTFISCDNVEIGRMAGRFIVEQLTKKNGSPKGRIVELTGMKGVKAAGDRHDGAYEILDQYPEIETVFSGTGNWFQNEAMTRMEEAYNATEGRFDAVYGHNDPMAYGAYLVVKEKNPELAKQVIFVGVDGLPDEGQAYVRQGYLSATFIYPLCVDKAVEVGMKILEDKNFKPEKLYILPSSAVTPETLAAKTD